MSRGRRSEMSEVAKHLLTKIGVDASLRYAIHLITASALACQSGREILWRWRILTEVYHLFLDVKRSTQYLMEYHSQYMFSEEGDEDDTNAMQSLSDSLGKTLCLFLYLGLLVLGQHWTFFMGKTALLLLISDYIFLWEPYKLQNLRFNHL
ncbi:hypothetical protein L3X38_022974 [Prunus dulcis]|uniref:RuvB-like helicase n=1 Tax=Prunus dulcis TaxID=3755 RepID=A0AAD4Z4T7_PRUDU|nr:hypothetical protein L3X38_022974 [Prunus dulcis]